MFGVRPRDAAGQGQEKLGHVGMGGGPAAERMRDPSTVRRGRAATSQSAGRGHPSVLGRHGRWPGRNWSTGDTVRFFAGGEPAWYER